MLMGDLAYNTFDGTGETLERNVGKFIVKSRSASLSFVNNLLLKQAVGRVGKNLSQCC